jgi:hypothetical protein
MRKTRIEQILSGLAPIADMRDGVPDFRLVPQAAVSNRSKPTLYLITVSARGWDEGQPETAKEMRRSCQSAAMEPS